MCIYLLLGSNLGDRQRNLLQAMELLKERGFNITKTSSIYQTSPWGKRDQPHFLNLVVEGKTGFLPERLLKEIKKIENVMGRTEKERWGVRPIDIDILFFNEKIINTPLLKIPHPQLPRRTFTLIPLNEIIPNLIHPLLGKSVKDLLSRVNDKGGVTKYI